MKLTTDPNPVSSLERAYHAFRESTANFMNAITLPVVRTAGRVISCKFCGRKRSWYDIDISLERLKKININRSQNNRLRDRDLNPGSECGYSTATKTVVSDYCTIIQKHLQTDLHLNCTYLTTRTVPYKQTPVG